MLRRVVIGTFVLTLPACGRAAPIRDVIIDEDGGVDDLIAISLLMRSEAVRVRAITICPADSYLESATRATQLFIEKSGGRDITIALGHSEGTNPFPASWRADAGRVLGIAALAGAMPKNTNPIATDDAAHHLAKLLSGDTSYTILETGPLTNIADALKLDPSIKLHIQRIYAMGGAVRVRGNVQQANHDGSAEWNIFNQPEAAAAVIQSGIPITLIPLDATYADSFGCDEQSAADARIPRPAGKPELDRVTARRAIVAARICAGRKCSVLLLGHAHRCGSS